MSRFKTELCNNLIELGVCKYGDRCHYAHGAHELRQVSRRHPKYRTESCKNFELTGRCPFGPRCSYVHPKPDLDSMIEQLTRYVQHTRAPKPDSEDDDENDNVSLFTRTATSTSLYSNSKSSSSDLNAQFTLDEANKENLFIPSCLPIETRERTFDAKENKLSYIDNIFDLKAPTTLSETAISKPQQSLAVNNQLNNQQTQQRQQQQKQQSVIQKPQQRIAMRALSSNNQTQSQQLEASNSYNLSSVSAATSSPFEVNNPLSDLFNSENYCAGSSLLPNRQLYTRF